jgi:hypothetical protein
MPLSSYLLYIHQYVSFVCFISAITTSHPLSVADLTALVDATSLPLVQGTLAQHTFDHPTRQTPSGMGKHRILGLDRLAAFFRLSYQPSATRVCYLSLTILQLSE